MSTDSKTNGLSIDGERFRVLINGEEQYSIWPADLDIPGGWQAVGDEGDKASCLAFVEANWTDMRPASLRRAMDGGVEPNR